MPSVCVSERAGSFGGLRLTATLLFEGLSPNCKFSILLLVIRTFLQMQMFDHNVSPAERS